MKSKCGRYIPWLVIALWAVACWAFFQQAYSYHFFYKEQNQLFLLSADHVATYRGCGWLARLSGDFLTQYYYYLYAGAAILTAVLAATGALLYAALRRLRAWRWPALAVALAAMTVEAVFQLRHDFPLAGSTALLGWAAALWLAVLPPSRWWRMAAAVVVVPLAAWLFGAPQTGRLGAPEWELESLLAVDNEYRFGRYDRVIALVEREEQPIAAKKFFYNLVMAQRGELPEHLLRFVPNELGTLHQIGPETPLYTIKNMNELYWALGDMTFCERAAMMANVFSPQNRNVRMVKRLAEVNLVSGDTLAARKYLRLLSHTAAYADWAQKAPQMDIYRQKAQLANRQDTLALTDNSHFMMMQLLDSNPQNTVALDYMLCTELLLKDIHNFKRDYDRYCSEWPRAKQLYQEALCIWLAANDAPPEEWRKYIVLPQVGQRFMDYSAHRGDPRYRDTYWYYFDTATASQP